MQSFPHIIEELACYGVAILSHATKTRLKTEVEYLECLVENLEEVSGWWRVECIYSFQPQGVTKAKEKSDEEFTIFGEIYLDTLAKSSCKRMCFMTFHCS